MPGIRTLLILALVVAGALAWVAFLPATSGALELRAGTLLEAPRSIEGFELIDQRGQPFGRGDLTGEWSLVFIGFTHCPDVCPSTLYLLDQLDRRLLDKGHDIGTVFVSVDPERDTPEVLAEYLGHFSDRIAGVTGSPAQLSGFCEQLDFAYVKIPGSEGRYTVDHSGALALIDPQARLLGYFLPPFEVDALTADIALAISRR